VGPPGSGKTTLAQIIANQTKSHFETLSAVLAGKAELREVIEAALERRNLYQKPTILFVKEVVEALN
jgi:putative ATPase